MNENMTVEFSGTVEEVVFSNADNHYAVIFLLNEKESPIVFMLWGGNARAKKALITNPRHLVLECAHPSPLSAYAGFFGCGHFTSANDFLLKNKLSPIKWEQINDFNEKDT